MTGFRRPGVGRLIAAVVALCVASGVLGWWLWRDDPAPYALRDAPEARLTVRAAESDYPEAARLARETEHLLRVYVQRLRAGDAEDLARIGAPWYSGREAAARDLISGFGAAADRPVRAVVADPVVPGLADVSFRFADGSEQRLHLTRADGVWWLALGDGDPMKP
ncbi:hypothetical protein JNUCC64_14550 [Streptomyces sp. JNUCC 64]